MYSRLAENDCVSLTLFLDPYVYMFSVSTTSDPFLYTFMSMSLLTDPASPFPHHAGQVPENIHAMFLDDLQLLAFAGDNIHRYDRQTGEWTDHGVYTCVTD